MLLKYKQEKKKPKLNQKREKNTRKLISKKLILKLKSKNLKPKGCMHVDRVRVVDHICTELIFVLLKY